MRILFRWKWQDPRRLPVEPESPPGCSDRKATGPPPCFAGRRGGSDLQITDEEGIQTGTGFIWDSAGHVVTNDHVVQGTSAIAVRLATGEVVRAEIVGVTANYDLAVILLERPT